MVPKCELVEQVNKVKSCCVVGCHNEYVKNSGISFHRFPHDQAKREKWIAAVKCENWVPNEYRYFVNGKKSNNLLAPNYLPFIFPHTDSPVNKKLERDVEMFACASCRVVSISSLLNCFLPLMNADIFTSAQYIWCYPVW